jgi:hypothetical protein
MSAFAKRSLTILMLLICMGLPGTKGLATTLRRGTITNGPSGLVCDDVTDDSAALQGLINAAEANCVVQPDQSIVGQSYIDLPQGKVCRIDQPIQLVGSCVGIEGNGATLDFKNLSQSNGVAITITSQHPASPYGDNAVVWSALNLVGPGSSTQTIGLLVETGEAVFQRPVIHGFGIGIQFGNYAFVDSIDHPAIFDVGTGISCPGNTTDSGENLTVTGGSIFNSEVAIDNQGCGLTLSGTSIDGMSGSAMTVQGGTVACDNCYIEYFASTAAPVFDLNGCNAWSYITFHGGTILNDFSGPNVMALIRNDPTETCGGSGSWARFDGVFFGNINPTGTCAVGSGPSCVMGSNAGQVSIIQGTSGDGGGTMGNVHLP